jgi:hypothetical protein
MIPRVVLIYGVLGWIPFLLPPVAGLVFPDARPVSLAILSVYGALILSFLGGARWGFAVAEPRPPPRVVSLAMLPTLIGLGLLLLPAGPRLLGLAIALVLHWLWDLFSDGLPPWYGPLRTALTAGAVVGLVAGVFLLT